MNHDRIATFLSNGLKPSQVATMVGCSPARITQIMGEEKFKLLLAEKQAAQTEADVEEASISAKYLAAEHALVNQVLELAPASELRDVTAALRVISERQEKMKSRMSPVSQGGNNTQVFVSVSLPAHAIPAPAIEMTNAREVTSIGTQTLAPLSSSAVTNLFSSMSGGKQNEPISSNPNPEVSLIEAPQAAVSKQGFLSYEPDFASS